MYDAPCVDCVDSDSDSGAVCVCVCVHTVPVPVPALVSVFVFLSVYVHVSAGTMFSLANLREHSLLGARLFAQSQKPGHGFIGKLCVDVDHNDNGVVQKGAKDDGQCV